MAGPQERLAELERLLREALGELPEPGPPTQQDYERWALEAGRLLFRNAVLDVERDIGVRDVLFDPWTSTLFAHCDIRLPTPLEYVTVIIDTDQPEGQ
jgi:hypothetical protein